MNDKNGENLRALFERFMDSGQARASVEDIERGEEILRGHPAPGPSVELVERINSEMAGKLVHSGKRHVRRFASWSAVAAAAVVIAAGIWTAIQLRENASPPTIPDRHPITSSIIPTAIWESDNIAIDDLHLASFGAEIERIESEFRGLLLGDDIRSVPEIEEYEFELMEIEGEFWKG